MVVITDDDLYELVMEYGLSIAYRMGCVCSTYLIERKEVLLQDIVALSARSDLKPVDILIRYRNRLHHNHSKILVK
jgi:hypothetical protein